MSSLTVPRELSLADLDLQDPGSGKPIPYQFWGQQVKLVTGAGAETNTLADPSKAGQRLDFIMRTDGGGDRVITAASAINQAGNTILTFADVEDFIALTSVRKVGGVGFRWQVLSNDGVALS